MLHLCGDSAPEAEEAKLHRSFRCGNLMHDSLLNLFTLFLLARFFTSLLVR